MSEIKTIYKGGFIPDLGIAVSGHMKGWLFFKHPDGQWVTLANLYDVFESMKPQKLDENKQ